MITIRDIHKRLKLLPESANIGSNYLPYLNKAESVINSENPEKIMRMIETGINDASNSILLETMLSLYDALYLYGNEHHIKTYANMIAEDYVPKVRDAKEAQTNLRRKLGRIKTAATTKVNSNIEDITTAINKAIEGLKGNYATNISAIKSNVQKGLPKRKASKAKNEAFIQGYERIIEATTKMIYCDRILDNYNRISKRFNIDKVIQENVYTNGIDDTIIHICHLLETYDVPDKVKYNTVLETVWYGFNKNYVDCAPSHYTTLITDYFMAKGNNRGMCTKLLEASMVVKKDDYDGDLEVLTEEEPEEDEIKFEAMAFQDQIRAHVVGYSGNPDIVLKEEANFNKIFNDFKKSDDRHKENKFQMLIRKLYAKNPKDIIQGTPSLLNYVRLVFVLGSCAIHPIIGGVALLTDIFLGLHTQRKETEAMLKCFKNEIAVSKKKMNSTTDPEEKVRLKSYIKELEKGYEKIDEYYEERLTDEEVDKKYDDNIESDDSFDDISGDDFGDFDDDDFGDFEDFDDMDFNESFICKAGILAERYADIPHKEFDDSMLSEMIKTAPIICSEMADIALYYPSIVDPIKLESVIMEELNALKHKESAAYTMGLLTDAKSKLEYSSIKPVPDATTLTEYESCLDDTVSILESLNDILQACHYYHPLIEGSFTNSIKLASEKVKRTLTKLSDKERQVSKNIDLAANNTKKAMEKSLTADNREAVIKGSVLPSASKTIKLAITTAGLGLINPALAVIGALGYLGMSKSYKHKERQMVIDEIEIELKMCEKYIEIAESKNDMKALKKLLTIQRELERQRQRIKYNMQVKFGQKYYDSQNAPASSVAD